MGERLMPGFRPGQACALIAVMLGFLVLPSLSAQAQGAPAERCSQIIEQQGLQWDPRNPQATKWVYSNIRSLCQRTPAATYPIDCFRAAIRQGLDYQHGMNLCRFDRGGCVFKSAISFRLNFNPDGTYSGPTAGGWDTIIRHCAFGEQLRLGPNGDRPTVNGGGFSGTCMKTLLNKAYFGVALNQDDVSRMCQFARDTGSPNDCALALEQNLRNYKGLRDRTGRFFGYTPGDNDYLKQSVVRVCANALNEVTSNCVFRGLGNNFDLDTVVEVCRAKENILRNMGLVPGTGRDHPLNALQAMGNNCVTRNSFDNAGSVNISNGWLRCRNQPLFN
ncbi:hypothetical protein [uncultured Roseibium sp.]|uniref:hypothetical protein n=1 Tax=uncultured Roseibium sp. TaxID=1936171 RepID=UPI0032175CAF